MSGEEAPANAESSRPVGSSEPLLDSSDIGSFKGFAPLTEAESEPLTEADSEPWERIDCVVSEDMTLVGPDYPLYVTADGGLILGPLPPEYPEDYEYSETPKEPAEEE